MRGGGGVHEACVGEGPKYKKIAGGGGGGAAVRFSYRLQMLNIMHGRLLQQEEAYVMMEACIGRGIWGKRGIVHRGK